MYTCIYSRMISQIIVLFTNTDDISVYIMVCRIKLSLPYTCENSDEFYMYCCMNYEPKLNIKISSVPKHVQLITFCINICICTCMRYFIRVCVY